MRILLAEDDTMLLMLYRKYLQGYDVTCCEDGGAAFSALLSSDLDQEKYDLLITDLKMPFRSGNDLIESKFLPEGIFIIVASGFFTHELRKKFSQNPNLVFVDKPINWHSFMMRIKEIEQRLEAKKKTQS